MAHAVPGVFEDGRVTLSREIDDNSRKDVIVLFIEGAKGSVIEKLAREIKEPQRADLIDRIISRKVGGDDIEKPR